MILTPALLRAATGCTAEAAERFAPHLDEACRAYGIDTFARYVAFLAQIGHESGSLRHVREVWGPTPAQQRYEGRADLGNVYPGDGQRYMGRGLIQTTGRHNYRAVRDRLRTRGHDAPDFERDPGSLESPKWAAWSAADYWDWRGLNALADRGDFESITRRINGGLNGHADRLRRLQMAREALAAHAPQTVYTPAPTAPPEASAPLIQPGPEPSDYYAPSGEAPDWVPPPPKEKPMAPFVAAALPAIVQSIPQLAKLFGSGSEVAQRNIAAAETVVGIVQQAVGASNAQEAAELVQSDPQARQKAAQAIEAQWFQLSESGGGGLEGARKAAVEASGGKPWQNPAMWITAALMPLVYMVTYIVLTSESFSQDVKSMVVGAVMLGTLGAVAQFWLGSSYGSSRKTDMLGR